MSKELASNSSSKRFKFQSLNSQLNKIKSKKFEFLENSEKSLFIENYEIEKDLNLTLKFQSLKFNFFNLEQLLHHRREIVQDLLRCAEIGTVVSITRLLSFLISDLQSELYVHIDEIFTKLTILLAETRPAEEVQSIFMLLKNTFKYLSEDLLLNIKKTWSFIQTLLVIPNIHIQRLTAENFAILIRKSKFNHEMIQLIIDSIQETGTEAVAMVIYESIRMVDHKFHSKTRSVIRHLFNTILNNQTESTSSCLEKILILSGHYGTAEGLQELIESVMTYNIQPTNPGFHLYTKLVYVMVGLRKMNRILDYKMVLETVEKCISTEFGVKSLDVYLK